MTSLKMDTMKKTAVHDCSEPKVKTGMESAKFVGPNLNVQSGFERKSGEFKWHE